MARYITASGREVAAVNPRRLVWRFSCGFWTDDADLAFSDDSFGKCPACSCTSWNQIEAHQHGPTCSRPCDAKKGKR